ncbi:MAG TPA: hypothetical protein VGO59_17475 [Verrucomicrobiae bacterium]|jgi:hypothetical protein
MKTLLSILFLGWSAFARAQEPAVETLVCIRHGEKPPGGLGQLACRGLNRALALPKVLLGKYGKPQFVFAPNPAQKADGKGNYNYIRPLMTIEPTAIQCGLPVNTAFGYKEIKGLEDELAKPAYQNSLVFVAWEHGLLDDFAKEMVKAYGGDPNQVPKWPGKDFDSIFLMKITRSNGTNAISFIIDHEGLDNLSDDCP